MNDEINLYRLVNGDLIIGKTDYERSLELSDNSHDVLLLVDPVQIIVTSEGYGLYRWSEISLTNHTILMVHSIVSIEKPSELIVKNYDKLINKPPQTTIMDGGVEFTIQ